MEDFPQTGGLIVKISRNGLSAVLAVALTTAGLIGVNAAAPAPQRAPAAAAVSLSSQLDTLLKNPAFTGSQVSLLVRDATTGATLFDRNSASRLLPASNMKLLTSAAAMRNLGSGFRFHTDVLTSGTVTGGVLTGDVYLKGYGDPTTLQQDYQSLADQIAAAGITSVHGDLVTDDRYFDSQRLGNFWSWDDEPYYYSAQTSALTVAPNTDYDSGTVIVVPKPGAAVGDPVELGLEPATGVIEFDNTATTGAAGSDNTLSVVREHGTSTVSVTGSVPLDAAPGEEFVTVNDPTAYAADVLRRALTAAGVTITGDTKPGTVPAGTRRIAVDRSATLGEIMVPFLKLSNNMHAEAITKTMGAVASGRGTWDAGLAVIMNYVKGSGGDPATILLNDGSGLSRGDYLTTTVISDVLVKSRTQPWFPQWYAALPIAGNADRFTGGTLRSRMVGTPAANNLHGKTGSLTGVTALSGYVTDRDGRMLVFSMISNNYLSSPRSVEDAVGVTLASYSAAHAKAGTLKSVVPQQAPAGSQPESEWVKTR